MTPLPDPDQTKAFHEIFEILAKILGFFSAFVSGIVAATWAIASKVRGYDERLKVLEKQNSAFIEKLDSKLNRIHERIDEMLLNGHETSYRKETRIEVETSEGNIEND